MNERDEVLSRLLDLFPKNLIKGTFKEKETIEVAKNNSDSEILEFTHINLDITKQHVYFLTHNIKQLSDLPDHIFTPNITKIDGQNGVEYFDLYDVAYNVYLENPYEAVKLIFKWPIRVIINNNLASIHYTILEKNIQSYFPNREIVTTKKSIDENEINKLIANDLSNFGIISIYDLNKGIKELWARDFIDALEVQYRKAKSISKETMDEEYTFKQQYPDLYEKAILAPLEKVSFKIIKDYDKYCDHFSIEPSLGKITFPTYSKKKEHIPNVIRKILELN